MLSRRPLIVFCALFTAGAHAQWLDYRAPGVPRTPDGKVDLTAPAPRANGKPDLSGVWHVQPTPLAEMKRLFGDDVTKLDVPGMEIDTISKYAVNILLDFKPEESPIRPEAANILARRLQDGGLPSENCLPLGIPLGSLVSELNRIVQSPTLIVIMHESDGSHRQIYTDGRGVLDEVSLPAWLGYSAGKWEGDTLVVETVGFNDKTWLDVLGHPHSEALRVVERYRRRDFGHLDVAMTFDDSLMYTRPFSIQVAYELQGDSDIFEYVCNENEKDSAHIGPQ
jgi:hypothetical protein